MTSISLSRAEGVSQDQLIEIAKDLRQYIAHENSSMLSTVENKIRNQPGMLARLFRSGYEKEEERALLERMRANSAAKAELVRIYHAVQVEIASKQGDVLIASVGTHLQAALAQFAQTKIHELTTTIEEGRERFLARMDPHMKTVDQYKDNPTLYEPARRSVQKEINTYFEASDELLDGFVQMLRSKMAPKAR